MTSTITTRKRSAAAVAAEHDNSGTFGEGVQSHLEPLNKKIMASSAQNVQRAGKWTLEEETLANQLVTDFENGTLEDCENDTTLRAYLARKLNCGLMRISKKFAKRQIGKLSFVRRQDGNPVITKGTKKRPSRRPPRKPRTDKSGQSLLWTKGAGMTTTMAMTTSNYHHNIYPNGSIDGLDEGDDPDGTGGVTDSCSDTDDMAFIDGPDPLGLNLSVVCQSSSQSSTGRSFMMSFMNTGSSSSYGSGRDHDRGVAGTGEGVGGGSSSDDDATTGDENDAPSSDNSDSGGSPNGSLTTAPLSISGTIPALAVDGPTHSYAPPTVPEQGLEPEQGLVPGQGLVVAQELEPGQELVPEQGLEPGQELEPDDDWTDVFLGIFREM